MATTYLSKVIYPGDGTTVNWSIPFPRLRNTHVFALVGTSTLSLGAGFTISANTLTFSVAPPNGQNFTIERITPIDNGGLVVNFEDGSSLEQVDLNALAQQVFYIAQENYDNVQLAFTAVQRAGDTMTGNLAMSGNKVTGLGTPTASGDATNKGYVDAADALKLNLTGGNLTGVLDLGGNKITSLANPGNAQDAVTKSYVDALTLAVGGLPVPNADGSDNTKIVQVVGTSWLRQTVAQLIATFPAQGIPFSNLPNLAASTVLANVGATSTPASAVTLAVLTPKLTPFVGDSGAGGTAGIVPAPSAGDTALSRVLGAGGSFVDQKRANWMQGRLTYTTGVAIPTTDITAATTVYLTPFNGNLISLYDGTRWNDRILASDASVSLSALGIFRLADVFVYDNAGTPTLEVAAWDASQITSTITGVSIATAAVLSTTNTTGYSVGDQIGILSIVGTTGTSAKQGLNGRVHRITAISSGVSITIESPTTGLAYTSGGTIYRIPSARSTALVSQNGILVKGGATTRRWVGLVMTWTTTGTSIDRNGASDTEGIRLIANAYNHVPRVCTVVDSVVSWSYGTTTWRIRDNSISNSHYILTTAGVPLKGRLSIRVTSTSSNNGGPYMGIGLNSILSNVAQSIGGCGNGASDGNRMPIYTEAYLTAGEGFQSVHALEYSSNGDLGFINDYNQGFASGTSPYPLLIQVNQ